MKKIFTFLTILFCCITISAQNISQFKTVPESEVQKSKSYIDGNKYQKDAILFVDLLSSTHPYYIKPERREILNSRLEGLLTKCAACSSDTEFVSLLKEVMPEVLDKHTDVMDMESYLNKKSSSSSTSSSTSEPSSKKPSPLTRSDELFTYQLFAKESICYLQFNQCNDARTLKDESLPRFDKLLNEMFSEMQKNNIETLIIDVQYNGGGSSRLCDELIDRIYPYSKVKGLDTYMRFSPLLALYNPKTESAMKAWNEAGKQNELYYMPEKKANVPEHEIFEGKVVFIQSKKTFSSAGILVTTARDNGIGEVIGEESTYSPSHYGEILPFKLPNTETLGTVCTKYFERADKSCAEDKTLIPDTYIDLSNKAAAWKKIMKMYSKK